MMEPGRFIIAECPRCHTLLVADRRHKSKTCHRCNTRLQIDGLSILETAKDAREARLLVSKAKERRGA